MLRTDIQKMVESAHSAQTTGKYAEGLERLKFFWDFTKPDEKPRTEGLEQKEVAELLQACGALFGFYGIPHKDAQEVSKNLLTDAYHKFSHLSLTENQLICSNHLALSYWRMGDTNNAKAWLDNSLNFKFPSEHLGILQAIIVESLLHNAAENYSAMLECLNKNEKTFKKSGDDYLIGLFYMNRGVAKKELRDFDGALKDQMTAREKFTELGHNQYYSYTENNMACVYQAKGEFKRAFECAARSLSVAQKIGDLRQVGCIYDTNAVIAFTSKDFETALYFADRAIAEIGKTECYSNLVEYYRTKIKILLAVTRFDEALDVYADAVAIAKQFTSANILYNLTATLSEFMREKSFIKVFREGHIVSVMDICRLIFKSKPYGAISFVEILSNRYRHFGVEKGFLAVIEEIPTQEGDFVAVIDKQTNSCHFGFNAIFDELIMLEAGKPNDIPCVFAENEAQILGKVVGFCPPEPDKDGNLLVIPFEAKKVR